MRQLACLHFHGGCWHLVTSNRKWQVSTGGGDSPLWSHDDRELFYRNSDSVIAVDVQTDPTFKAGKPKPLFQGAYLSSGGHAWDLPPDGRRFLMIKETAAEVISALVKESKLKVVAGYYDIASGRATLLD
jgi:hypothetical protein